MSAGLCHPVCVRALVRVVYIPPLASICKHLRPVCLKSVKCVSSVSQVCLKFVSSVSQVGPVNSSAV